MVKTALAQTMNEIPVDCACVIHSDVYDWVYVDKLYSMLSRNFSRPVRLHVWTEKDRMVPDHMVKHELEQWPGIAGKRKSWWYKMQMFNPEHHHGRLLYFDLDVVILQNLDWMLDLDPGFFWAIRDFRYHFKGDWYSINSSCMIWDTAKFANIWQDFSTQNIHAMVRRFHGDQDYLNSVLEENQRRYFDQDVIKSWRWEIKDGGLDFRKRIYKQPGAGSVLPINTHIMVFHGHPKPHEIDDNIIKQNWC